MGRTMRSFTMVFIVILLIYGSTSYFVGKRLYQCAAYLFPNINGPVYIGMYGLLTLSLILGFLPIPGVRSVMRWISAYWMGIFIYLLIFLVAAEIVVLIGGLTKLIPGPLPPHIRFYASAAAVVLTAAVFCYGLYNASQVKTVSYEVQLKTALSEEMNIVLISDLHLGDAFSESRFERAVREINQIKPDIVCIAGDIFSNDFNAIRDPDKVIAAFRSIETSFGVYACLGNHDAGAMIGEMIGLLERGDVKLLNEDYEVIDGRLILLGRLDRSPIGGFGGLRRKDAAEMTDMIKSWNTDLPVVVMEHNPANIDQYGGEVDLILSGHTHRGQIFPGGLITNAMYTVHYGYYQENAGSPQVIVTQGAGTWMLPVRIGTGNEVVSITLR